MRTGVSLVENTLQKAQTTQDFPLEVRPVSTADLDGLRDMLARLSPESVYRRFHMPLAKVPERILRRLMDGDGSGERRMVAVSEGRIVGHAMYSVSGEGEAEVGVIVEDAWQSRGIAKVLLHRLATEACCEEIEAFACTSLWENRQVAGLVKALCPSASLEIRDGLRLVRAPLGESNQIP